jgi:hypothetical protein
MKKRFVALLALISLSLSSCVYTNITMPLDDDVWDTKLGDKVGIASSRSALWLFAWGDAGTYAAAKNGNITKITHLDQGIESFLFGLYTRRDTIAYGE